MTLARWRKGVLDHSVLLTSPSLSRISPSSQISCPTPSLTHCAATKPTKATEAMSHQPRPTIPMLSPLPKTQENMMGPIVLVRLDTDCPIPCTVPNTDGCGLTLLTKIVVQGNANVRARTWMNRTPMTAIQMNGPLTPAGGALQLGTRLRNGASV